ncbi:hypothetical protein [Microbacterium sp.]|uniref:hypothetical protein n=1 Tax=Microbacterium sp. TaxID=51671 RepID=UPI002FDF5013
MSEYKPSLEEKRSGAKAIEAALNQCGISVIYALAGPSELFDVASVLLKSQWIADHDAKVRAEALREAAAGLPEAAGTNCGASCHEADRISLRDRADRIERGEQA